MPTTQAIVVVEAEGRPPRKVLRIIASRDGSFAIAVLFYPLIPGEIHKVGGPTIVNPEHSGWMSPIDAHRVEVPVKMMFHAGSFVQFSSFGKKPIRSGRRELYVPKGMGIHSHPVLAPVETGPALTIRRDPHRDEAGHRHDPAAFADLEVRRVEPQVRAGEITERP
jgi:hypothetical protein